MVETLTQEEYQFILRLIGEARGQGLYELEYKGLKLKLRPLPDPKSPDLDRRTLTGMLVQGI